VVDSELLKNSLLRINGLREWPQKNVPKNLVETEKLPNLRALIKEKYGPFTQNIEIQPLTSYPI
jgi:hypothetical protein